MPFVLDTSVTIPWAFEAAGNPYAAYVRDLLTEDDAVVPPIWPVEVVNAVLVNERAGRLDAAQSTQFLAILITLDIAVDVTETARFFRSVLALAREQNLTSYDAAYLELARRDGIPLATADRALRAAAQRIGVALIEMPQETQGTEG